MPLLARCAIFVLLVACGSGAAGPDAGGGTPADCMQRCTSKAQTCGAPAANAAQACGMLCPRVTSAAQLSCLEGSSCMELTAVFQQTGSVCGIGNGTPVDGGVVPGFGDTCMCSGGGTSGEFECSGTGICTSGLSCIGQTFGGVSQGTCRGPVCCSGSADCAAKLGKQSSCGSGQQCVCPRGDLECVGTACTCAGGVPATRGLCYPD